MATAVRLEEDQQPERPTLRAMQGGAAKPKLELPARPKLAPDVKLAGQLEESAYKDPPWLLEREESGYVQVTELLYRIAELCDGNRTYEEIAQAVSEKTGREVSKENVAQLVARELLIKGIVEDGNGKVVKPPAAARSLLAIRGRLALLGKDKIHPPTNVLKVLFWPPILLVTLAVVAVAEVWLFATHGVGGGMHEALYNPALILPLLVLTVASAVFHEFGHASALRYGGGDVRGMGAGLYLIYPVLYTDVSDNYRLKRWDRIRTDLGGFYFNLIFSLGLMGAYLATGLEFLLVVVALINLDIVKQLMPFIRFDGYWTLVDLTGMPDFFSQIGGFVKGLIPGRERKEGEPKQPELKWWAKIVFTLYILITVPFLIFSLIMLLRSAPRVLATVWDSGVKVVGQLGDANAAGDYLAVAGFVGQLLLLALPAAGILYATFNLLKRGFTLLYKWGRGSWLKSTAGGLMAALALGVLALLWLPTIPVIGAPTPLYREAVFAPFQADERLSLRDAVSGRTVQRDGTELRPQPVIALPGQPTARAAVQATSQPQATPPGTPRASTPQPARTAVPGAPVVGVAPTATARPATAATPISTPISTVRPASTPPAQSTVPAQSTTTGTGLATPTRGVATSTPVR